MFQRQRAIAQVSSSNELRKSPPPSLIAPNLSNANDAEYVESGDEDMGIDIDSPLHTVPSSPGSSKSVGLIEITPEDEESISIIPATTYDHSSPGILDTFEMQPEILECTGVEPDWPMKPIWSNFPVDLFDDPNGLEFVLHSFVDHGRGLKVKSKRCNNVGIINTTCAECRAVNAAGNPKMKVLRDRACDAKKKTKYMFLTKSQMDIRLREVSEAVKWKSLEVGNQRSLHGHKIDSSCRYLCFHAELDHFLLKMMTKNGLSLQFHPVTMRISTGSLHVL